MKVKVDGDGQVKSVEVQGLANGSQEADCVVAAVMKLSFASSETGGEATWTLPFY